MSDLTVQTKKFQKELNAGTSSLVLLKVLSCSKEPMYGYQIAKLLEDNGPDLPLMKQGTLYPVLRSLEENGLLQSIVEPSVYGPPRRYYNITDEGQAAWKEWLEIWKQTKKFVDAILKDDDMFNTIEEYLDALKTEMQGSDPALLQDAIADAREHLTTALVVAREKNGGVTEADALKIIIDEYGTPEETASAYKEVERRTSPSLKQTNTKPRSATEGFFSVYADARAWGALLYMLIAFITGVFYFSWAVTGVSISISFLIFIFGFPIALLFLLSVRGLALLEGRLVEALLGVRMPRRPLFTHQGMKWFDRLKALLLDKATWLMLVYMIIQFVLGTVYFVSIVTVLSFSLSFIAFPFLQEILPAGTLYIGNGRYIFPTWSYPLFVLGGFLLWTTFMNIARGIGQLHGRLAKWMLVTD